MKLRWLILWGVMWFLIGSLTAICLFGCSFTISTSPPKPVAVHGKPTHKSKTSSHGNPLIVDQDWVEQYRELEQQHNYRLQNDTVTPVGNGKYRITKPMLEHFSALSQAPPPATPSPAP